MWADPAYGKRFGDLDATKNRAVFQLTAKNNTNVTETDESPLEIGEPENGRQGQDAMDGGLRRTETGTKLPGAILNNACVGPEGARPMDGPSNLEFRRAAGWSS